MNCPGIACGWSLILLPIALVTNQEYAEFIADGGYRKSELWLSSGWDPEEQNGWQAPLYWNADGENWTLYTLRGETSLEEACECARKPHQLL